MIHCYVTVHDVSLIAECELSGQFDALGDRYSYLFVGPRPVSDIPADARVIVARDLVPNIEHLPSFYDFTGWSTLCRHNLIEAERVILIQYDMLISDPDIIGKVDALLDDPGVSMVAFTAGHRLADNWMLLLPGFQQTFDNAMRTIGSDQSTFPFFNEWPSTQGTAWRTTEFVEYMAWIEPLFEQWASDVWAGHLMERTVKPWTVRDGRPEAYLGGMTHHLARDCHGTCALMGGRSDVHAERAATFGRV